MTNHTIFSSGIGALLAFSVGGATVACSSSSSSGVSDDGGGVVIADAAGDAATDAGADAFVGIDAAQAIDSAVNGCTPADGTYMTTYAAAAGNVATCPTISPDTSNYPQEGGAADAAGPGCTQSCSGSTYTEHCVGTADGGVVTSTTAISATITSTGATGTLVLDGIGPDGGVVESCSYAITVTKQ